MHGAKTLKKAFLNFIIFIDFNSFLCRVTLAYTFYDFIIYELRSQPYTWMM